VSAEIQAWFEDYQQKLGNEAATPKPAESRLGRFDSPAHLFDRSCGDRVGCVTYCAMVAVPELDTGAT